MEKKTTYTKGFGCQSVSCLYAKKDKLTKDLRVIAKIIEIKSNSELISKITYNTNNQNGIKVRDFRSNTDTQTRIQKDINKNYPQYFYQIKTGEKIPQDKIAIDNQLAGSLGQFKESKKYLKILMQKFLLVQKLLEEELLLCLNFIQKFLKT